jgi:hypothetical protein
VTGDGGNRGESNPRSPRRGNSHRIQLEEGVEGVEATDLPRCRRRKSPELAGMLGRRRRRLGFARAPRGREGERVGAGQGRFDRPRPEPVWFNQARWAGLGLMGQSPFSNQIQISNLKVLFSFELIQIQN